MSNKLTAIHVGPAPARLPAGLWLAAVLTLTPSLASAYVGPGLGLGALGSLGALVGAVVLGIVGFIWYPFKRLLRAMRRQRARDD